MAKRPTDHKRKAGPRPMRSLVEIHTENAPDEPDPIELVRIDGQSYYMPGRVPASLTLQVLDKIAEEGEMVGMAWMMREVLGGEAYDALKNCPAMTMDQLQEIMEYVGDHVLGEMEGNS